MSKYKLAVFDLDGTLLDTTEGVLSSIKYTINHFGFKMLGDDDLKKFIGPPIQKSFADTYNLSGDILQEIATVFRDRYKGDDLFKAKPYDEIFDMLKNLTDAGVVCAAATYKREDYAIKLLKHFGFDKYMNIMFGSDHENKLKKSDIIEKCLYAAKIKDKALAVMIGDTINDAVGAEQIGIDFIAVTYGFGFKSVNELNEIKMTGCADNTKNIQKFIL